MWEYDSAIFVETLVRSNWLAAALDPDDAQVLDLGQFAVTFPVLADHVNWWHRSRDAR